MLKKIVPFSLLAVLLISCAKSDNSTEPIVVDEPDPVVVFASPCENGSAGGFPCDDYGLVANIDLSTLIAASGNDIWGWTDPTTAKEYAIMGLNNGTAFIDISTPETPVYLGKLPTRTVNSGWRDIKVYSNHAFIVSEAEDHGMQVFDLSRLRNVTSPPTTFTADAEYTEFGNAHNIVINENTGFAYVVGTQTFNGGPHFVDIQDPVNPTAAGGYAMDDYSHDAQVVTYNGPDADYQGKEILIGSNVNEITIVDITDKANPQSISTLSYGQVGYTHQGWFTDDQRYFLFGDELDEINFGFNSRTIVLDLTDLDNPEVHTEYFSSVPAIDHNGYVNGSLFYQANYTGGMRVIDISGISNGELMEVGYFDTFPGDDSAIFRGAWSVYPFFSSGNIIISDINSGFYIVRKQ